MYVLYMSNNPKAESLSLEEIASIYTQAECVEKVDIEEALQYIVNKLGIQELELMVSKSGKIYELQRTMWLAAYQKWYEKTIELIEKILKETKIRLNKNILIGVLGLTNIMECVTEDDIKFLVENYGEFQLYQLPAIFSRLEEVYVISAYSCLG